MAQNTAIGLNNLYGINDMDRSIQRLPPRAPDHAAVYRAAYHLGLPFDSTTGLLYASDLPGHASALFALADKISGEEAQRVSP